MFRVAQPAVAENEAGGPDHVHRHIQASGQPQHRAGILRNVRLEQRQARFWVHIQGIYPLQSDVYRLYQGRLQSPKPMIFPIPGPGHGRFNLNLETK